MVSHCEFPGSGDKLKLDTMLKVNNFVIGENCLTYQYEFNQKTKKLT